MAKINTIYGEMDTADLVKTEGSIDTPRESTTWVEYRKPGNDEIVHRSVHVIVKELGVTVGGAVGKW